jgi:hypothetical protein
MKYLKIEVLTLVVMKSSMGQPMKNGNDESFCLMGELTGTDLLSLISFPFSYLLTELSPS